MIPAGPAPPPPAARAAHNLCGWVRVGVPLKRLHIRTCGAHRPGPRRSALYPDWSRQPAPSVRLTTLTRRRRRGARAPARRHYLLASRRRRRRRNLRAGAGPGRESPPAELSRRECCPLSNQDQAFVGKLITHSLPSMASIGPGPQCRSDQLRRSEGPRSPYKRSSMDHRNGTVW